jgi:hypothetical protein
MLRGDFAYPEMQKEKELVLSSDGAPVIVVPLESVLALK